MKPLQWRILIFLGHQLLIFMEKYISRLNSIFPYVIVVLFIVNTTLTVHLKNYFILQLCSEEFLVTSMHEYL